MLKIGWKNWDKYLQPFNKKKNTMIELGSYKGEATCKLLTHLATHYIEYDFISRYSKM
jgi:hypothetical protein